MSGRQNLTPHMDPSREVRLAAAHFSPQGFRAAEKLEERWAFPSDHLPVAAEVSGIRIGSWNVLNRKWVHYFREDKEGLARSALITEDRRLKKSSAWTKREEHALQIALGLSRKLHVLALQECSAEFIERLAGALPPHLSLKKGRSERSENDIALVYSTRKLRVNQGRSRVYEEGFRCKSGKPVMDLWLEPHTGRPFKLIHTHVPGDPTMPGLEELAQGYFRAPSVARAPFIVVGDLNFTEERIRSVWAQFPMPTFLRLANLNSSVGPDGRPKGIDHILAFNIEAYFCRELGADSLGEEVASASRLINP